MSWNGSVRILVTQTRPVCTSWMKNSCTVRNSSAADADDQPDLRDVAHELAGVGVRLEDAEQRRIEIERKRRQRPDRQQHDLALQVVADLDLFLVLVAWPG